MNQSEKVDVPLCARAPALKPRRRMKHLSTYGLVKTRFGREFATVQHKRKNSAARKVSERNQLEGLWRKVQAMKAENLRLKEINSSLQQEVQEVFEKVVEQSKQLMTSM